MVSLYSFIFFVTLIIAVVSFIVYVVAIIRNKRNKSGLVSLVSFIISIVAFSLAIYQTNKDIENYVIPENREAVISYAHYSRATAENVRAALGEPDSKSEKEIYGPYNGTYITTTWSYNDKRLEFMFISNRVVQFTYYGDNQPFEHINEVLDLFGITSGPEITLVSENRKMLSYQKVDPYGIIDDFSLVYGDTEKTIGIVKITYDSSYF